MKIRNGFVSNSSSASFCIIYTDKSSIKLALKSFSPKEKRFLYEFMSDRTTFNTYVNKVKLIVKHGIYCTDELIDLYRKHFECEDTIEEDALDLINKFFRQINIIKNCQANLEDF